MKNILVPIDFSDCAKNALRYAAKLAEVFEARLTVLYVHKPELVLVETVPVNIIYTESSNLEPEIINRINELKLFLKDYAKVPTEFLVKEGGITEEVLHQAKETQSDLIVMGTEGVESTFGLLWGNSTSNIIGKRKCPVLAVPENYTEELKEGAEFIFATDFEKINDWYVLDFYKTLAIKIKAKINVFYVVKKELESAELEEYEEERFALLEEFFEGLEVELYHSFENDVVEGVEEFVNETNASLITLISHERGFIENLFHKSITKAMAINATVPFLAIPDVHLDLNGSTGTGYW